MQAQWNNSTPPAAGWYAASIERDARMVRYWSGTAWSAPTWRVDAEPFYRDRCRNTSADIDAGDVIEWQHLTADEAALLTA